MKDIAMFVAFLVVVIGFTMFLLAPTIALAVIGGIISVGGILTITMMLFRGWNDILHR